MVGPLLHTTQNKAWVNQDLIVKWIDAMFPIVDVSPGKCLVWDSCRAHIAQRVKEYCRQRSITLVVIPGGLTPYLQAGDIGIYKDFKDQVCQYITAWKNSDGVEYTNGGNPRPPPNEIIRCWVKDAWNGVSSNNVLRCIQSAGFSSRYEDWHIAKHDIYGEKFCRAWNNSSPREVDPTSLEAIFQDDDIDVLDDALDGLELDHD